MKILLVGTDLDTNKGTGMFRYIENLLKGWSKNEADNDYTVITRYPPNLSIKMDSRFHFVTLRPQLMRNVFAWQNFDLPLYLTKNNFDVIFFPSYFIPLWGLRKPIVTLIYDVSFLAHPEWVPPLKYQLMKITTLRAGRYSKIIITGSEYDKYQIVKYLMVSPENVKVIYGAAAEKFVKKKPDPYFREKYGLGSGRVISCIGLIFNRRHQDVVVRAFNRLADKEEDIRLLLVGQNATYPFINIDALIDKCRHRDRIIHVPYMPDEDMVDIYNTSEALIYLTSHEGESFPLREALACGVPCVTTPMLHEVCGGAAVYVENPKDELCVEEGIREVLERRSVIASIAESMRSNRSWSNIANETLSYISKACER